MDIENSVVLITGANRGIGKGYVEGFLEAGAKKIYLGVRNPDSVSDIVTANPEKLIPLQLDVTNPEHIRAAAETAKDVTILVNNAGVLFMSSLQDAQTPENAHKEMEVNYFGPLALIQAFAPILKVNGGGAIVTVSSIAGHLSFPGIATYSASKAAVHSLIMATRMELAAQGTQVIGVYPGPIDTDMTRDFDMEKAPASQVAQETIKALRENIEDVFTDEMARDLYQSLRQDPKAVEQQMQEMYADMAQAA